MGSHVKGLAGLHVAEAWSSGGVCSDFASNIFIQAVLVTTAVTAGCYKRRTVIMIAPKDVRSGMTE